MECFNRRYAKTKGLGIYYINKEIIVPLQSANYTSSLLKKREIEVEIQCNSLSFINLINYYDKQENPADHDWRK